MKIHVYYFTAKSPSFTHFTATLSGLSTVRAYKVEDTLRNQFDNHQDAHSACWFIYMSALSAFSFFIDVLCVIFISCVIFYYMIFDTGASGAQIGLVITQAIKITGLVAMSEIDFSKMIYTMISLIVLQHHCCLFFFFRYTTKCISQSANDDC